MEGKPTTANPRRELVREELLSKAAEVFAQRGFRHTRIQDIAAAMSLSRSALYHYFTSKEEILTALVQEHTQSRAEVLRILAQDRARPAADRLREALRATVVERLVGGARLRVLDQLALEMPPDLRKSFDAGRRKILDVYTDIVADGIERGEFRPVDARTAALAVLGIASWTSWWYSPSGRKKPDELADLLVDLGLNGLVLGASIAPAKEKADLLVEIRDRLDRLAAL